MSLSIGSISGGSSGWNAGNINDKLKEVQDIKKNLMVDNFKKVSSPEYLQGSTGMQLGGSDIVERSSFVDLIKDGMSAVDTKLKQSDNEVRKVMAGESDNVHQSMIRIQESTVAFNLLIETRNQVMNAFQELTKMNV